MVHPANNYGFRAKERFHSKAQLADNGHSLFKSCNAAVGPLFCSLRAWLSAPTDCVALIKRRTTMSSKVRLAVNADSHAESAFISWMDH
ncbi:hypothetical protein AB833_29340 [Chromatiales bacterium (ex Bugula neritina AB1)]|nr:hypothetical protein AB833_29340 [Chromatiales bacterium (ex Bugula neritina AB1)]